MSRIKVIVKGQSGSGHHRTAEAIFAMLDSKGANIRVDSGDAVLRTGYATMFNARGLRVKLKVVQEPREEVPVRAADEPCRCKTLGDWNGNHHPLCDGEVMMAVNEEEARYILTRRGQKMTHYSVHQDKEGRFYYWSWGRQPAGELLNQIADINPVIAAKKFLTIYLPCDPASWGSCIQPKRKDGQPIVGETC
jgi:hypothetical protein